MVCFFKDGEEPGLLESLIPICGSGKESVYHFQQGNYVRGVLWGAMAITDIFLVKAIAVSGWKLAGRAGASLFARHNLLKAQEISTTAVVHLTSKAGEQGIRATGKVGGQYGVFGLAASKVPKTQFGRSAATLVGKEISQPILITGEAVKAFNRPPVYGVCSATRRFLGHQSTRLGSVDLATSRFVEGEILKNGAFRQATWAERAMFEGHQFLLDYGFDAIIYTGGKLGIKINDQSSE
jgi:hypothetical protein